MTHVDSRFPTRDDDHHLIVSNFNTDPSLIVRRFTNFTILDQSTDESFSATLLKKFPDAIKSPHVGHNLGDYFGFIYENWNSLPKTLILGKGNLIGRHVTQEFFDQVYTNDTYTPLYHDPHANFRKGVSSLLTPNAYLERNTSWYLSSRPRRFFTSYSSALEFFFLDPVHPDWVEFSPGGCYIVPRSQIVRYPRDFFRVLHFLVSYDFFPAEAYLVERLLHTVWTSEYLLKSHATSLEFALPQLDRLAQQTAKVSSRRHTFTRRLSSIRRRFADAHRVLIHGAGK